MTCSIPRTELALALALGCAGERGPRREAFGHPQPVYGGVFHYADDDDIRSMDPATGYDEPSWTAMHLVFETLIGYDPDEVELVPELAESWEISEAGELWTFHLRDAVRFHNGRQVVADDVVYSWSRLLDPELASPGADFFTIIEGADAVLAGEADAVSGLRAPDPRTVEVRLTHPDAAFGNVVAMIFGAVVPREEVEARGEQWRYQPVGTGPFQVVEWQLGERTEFRANRDYWRPGLPYLDGVVHLARYPRPLQFLKLEADELQQVERLTSPDYLWVKRHPRWSAQLQEVASIDTYAQLMNTELPPFDDVWFRRAVSTAIDRDKLSQLRNRRLQPTVSWVPPGLDGNEEWEDLDDEARAFYRYQRYDPELALECLARAGYPDGYPDVIPYTTATDEASLVTAQSVQQDLARVGIRIEIRNLTFPAYLTAIGRRRAVPMAYTAWVMDYPDPRNFLETRFHCDQRAEENSNNDSFYCNPEVDALLDEADVELDRARRTELYRRAQRLVALDAPYAVEYHSTALSTTQPYVKGFRLHPVWTRDMSRAWLDLPPDGTVGRPAP